MHAIIAMHPRLMVIITDLHHQRHEPQFVIRPVAELFPFPEVLGTVRGSLEIVEHVDKGATEFRIFELRVALSKPRHWATWVHVQFKCTGSKRQLAASVRRAQTGIGGIRLLGHGHAVHFSDFHVSDLRINTNQGEIERRRFHRFAHDLRGYDIGLKTIGIARLGQQLFGFGGVVFEQSCDIRALSIHIL